MKSKFTSTIAGASIFISFIGVLSRGLGFIREMIFANNFGLQTEFDLYLVGAVLPITINSIILYIGQNYFVPGFQKINTTASDGAQKFYKQTFILFVGIGAILTLTLFLVSEFVIDSYMHQAPVESKEIASQIFRIFLLTIPFSAAISVFSALLQAVYEYKYPAISILFMNISVITLLILFSDQFGVYIIPIGFVLGTVLQFTYLLYRSQKVLALNLFRRHRELIFSRSAINSSLLVIILIESISQLYSLFDRYFYAEISEGGIASLNYALIIWFLPISIFSISLATAVFPKITNAIHNDSSDSIEGIYNFSISINTFLFIPAAFILFYYGDTIIRVVFERGKFVAESTSITFSVLKYYSLSLVFYSVYAVFNKIFYSINKINILLWITLIGVFLKLSFNFLLIDLQQDGLALSTSISFIFLFSASYIILNIKLAIKNRSLFLKDFLFHGINCAICLLITILLTEYLLSGDLISEILSVLVFFFLYFVNTFLAQHSSIKITLKMLGKLNIFSSFKLV